MLLGGGPNQATFYVLDPDGLGRGQGQKTVVAEYDGISYRYERSYGRPESTGRRLFFSGGNVTGSEFWIAEADGNASSLNPRIDVYTTPLD
jgi:hypothetical protein